MFPREETFDSFKIKSIVDIRKYAIILAGGSGLRAGGKLPKQFRQICGRPILWWALKAFYDEDPSTRLILVLHPGFFDDWDMICANLPEKDRIPHEIVCGGRDRGASVFNGLNAIPAEADGMVAIHDAARPLVSVEIIRRGWEKCRKEGIGIVPVIAVTDSLRYICGEESRAVDRSCYVGVQTPQIFPIWLLREAYARAGTDFSRFTDDASVAEAAGFRVGLFEGSPDNMKVTHPADFYVAEVLLTRRQQPS